MHIIWLPHESHAGMSLPTADLRVQPAGIWLCQESLRHILASPGYAPGTIVVNVTWMERGFNACQTHRSMYPSIFNRFLVIQPVSSNVRHFSTFFCIKMHLALLLYSHFFWGKVLYVIQCFVFSFPLSFSWCMSRTKLALRQFLITWK